MKYTSSIVPAALLALTSWSITTAVDAQGSAPLNETERRAVVESAAKMLRERYGGRARNPITGTNWEGVGVQPDIAVPSENALKAALERLTVSSVGGEIDALSRSRVFEPAGPRA